MKKCPICYENLCDITEYITYCDSCGYIVINNEKKIIKNDLILKNGMDGEEINKKDISHIECVPYINTYCKRLFWGNLVLMALSIAVLIKSYCW